jgi:hypothetical protein
MNELDVGLLGTLDEQQSPPLPEVAATGHLALNHRTRRGEPARSWYRGPLGPQPTQRVTPTAGVLPLAHTGDQLRRVVPDGREDISLAAMFEIGRLLTLSKPALVASLMQWRRDLFGAARARELSQLLQAGLFPDFGITAIGGRGSLEGLIRSSVVAAFTGLPPEALAPTAQLVTGSRVPDALAELGYDEVLAGLGADPRRVPEITKLFGVEGLGMVPIAVDQARTTPISQDGKAIAGLQAQLAHRVDQLTADALELGRGQPHGVRRRRTDTLDRLIDEATAVAEAAQQPGEH